MAGGGGGFASPLWIAQAEQTLYAALPAPAATYQSTWFDFSNTKRASIQIVNTTNQAVSVQLIGNMIQSTEVPVRSTARNMGIPIAISAGGSIDIGVGTNDDWHRYIGVLITTSVAPATGLVTVTVTPQA